MFYRLQVVVNISSNRKEYKVEPGKIIHATCKHGRPEKPSHHVLYFFILLHILLNIKRKAVNSTPVTFTGHLINGGQYTPKKINCKRILKVVPILVSKSSSKALKKNRRKIKKTTKNYKKIQK